MLGELTWPAGKGIATPSTAQERFGDRDEYQVPEPFLGTGSKWPALRGSLGNAS